MQTTPQSFAQLDRGAQHRVAAEVVYRFLSAMFSGKAVGLHDPAQQELAIAAADFLRTRCAAPDAPRGFGEEPPDALDLSRLCEELADSRFDLAAEHVRVFGLTPCRECTPYETDYHANEDPFFRSQQMADVAGFYRAFGVRPGGAMGRERPDHIALELEFMGLLLVKERLADQGAGPQVDQRRDVCRDAQHAFLRDHLGWWAPAFAQAVWRRAESGALAQAALALAAFVPAERQRLGVPPFFSPVEARPAEPESSQQCAGCALAHPE